MHRLLLASRNPHKTREFTEILGDRFAIRDLIGLADFPEIEETGKTFEENAILKAIAVSRHFPETLVVADDSGLEVDVLQGAPGIYSARYAGPQASDTSNVTKLLGELDRIGCTKPVPGRFRCVLALARDGELVRTFEGTVDGVIVNPPRGTSGFGYDPVFQPIGFDRTFAELSAAEKNAVSHRASAIRLLRETPSVGALL